MEAEKKLLGVVSNFQAGNRKQELFPVRVKDWTDFSTVVFILSVSTLHEIFLYPEGLDSLQKVFTIVTREEELPELFEEITQLEYSELRRIILEQNDIDFEALFEKSKKAQSQEDTKKKEQETLDLNQPLASKKA